VERQEKGDFMRRGRVPSSMVLEKKICLRCKTTTPPRGKEKKRQGDPSEESNLSILGGGSHRSFGTEGSQLLRVWEKERTNRTIERKGDPMRDFPRKKPSSRYRARAAEGEPPPMMKDLPTWVIETLLREVGCTFCMFGKQRRGFDIVSRGSADTGAGHAE